jgi:4-hydroxybenzoate polyprenyltransferase
VAKLSQRESYEKVEFFPKKIRAYIDLIRPFTLLAPAIGGTGAALIGLCLANNSFITAPLVMENLTTLIWGVSTLVIVNAASNSLNAAYDVDIDKINKPYRPIPSGVVTKDEARSLAWILYLVTIWRAATAFRFTYSFLVLFIMLITIGYSMPPMRFKQRLWISNISVAWARGMLGFVAAWAIFSDPFQPYNGWPFDPRPWGIGLIMFIFLTGATTTKDITDIDGDRRFGMRTLPVVYGLKKAAIYSSPFLIVPFLLIPVEVMMGIMDWHANLLVVLVAWACYLIYLLLKSDFSKRQKLENSPVWTHMYLMLLAMQLGFMAVYVFPISLPH